MSTTSTVLPPDIVLSPSTVYASQGSVYALEANSGTLGQRYPVNGLACPTVVNDVLYLNVSRHPDYMIQALYRDDGAPLWSYRVEGRLADAPVIADGVVYASVAEGTIYALQASDGTLLWRSTIDLGPDVPSFLGPIVFASPTVVEKVLYLAPAVNPPLQPFVYAFQTQDGTLLWRAPLDSSTSFPLIVVDGVIYLSTHSSCLALRASDGSSLWQQQLGTTTGAEYPTAPVAAHGTIYIGANDGYLYALRAGDGTLLWSYKTNATWLSSPKVAGGVLYVGANDGCVYALNAADGVLLWKTFVSASVTVSFSSVIVHHEEIEE